MCMCACTCIPSLVYDDNFTSKCTRFNLREPIFQTFPGGACPQTPLNLACFACKCALHTTNVYF